MNGRDELLLLAELRENLRNGEAQRVRQGARVTVAEVARALGVTQGAVAQWERGVRSPRGDIAVMYARILDDLGKVAG